MVRALPIGPFIVQFGKGGLDGPRVRVIDGVGWVGVDANLKYIDKML